MSSAQQPAADPQAQQAGLAIALAGVLAALWPSLDLSDLRGSLPSFKAAVAVEVQRYARASATLAARQYRTQRVAAGVRGAFTPLPADPPPVDQIAATVDWATQPLWNSNVVAHAESGGSAGTAVAVPDAESEAPGASSAIADAKARLAAATERQVLDAGRDTIVANVAKDRQAKGWARIPEPGACSFCLMLATRGAVYKDKSFNVASAKFNGEGLAKTHDHCRCHMEPVFTAYEPSAVVREAQRLYAESTRGKSGKAALKAFRQAVEGRTPQQ